MTRAGLLCRRGFSLIELMIALSLSAFVMVGVVGLSTNMVRSQFEEVRRGKVTGSTLLALDQMRRELAEASHLEPNRPTVAGTDYLSGCTNWTAATSPAGAIDASAPTTSFYYCVDASNSLRRYEGTTCPYPVPGSCSGGTAIVYQNFYHAPTSTFFFKRSNEVGGVELHFIVGNPTPTTQVPVPVYYQFDTKITMNKTYGNGSD